MVDKIEKKMSIASGNPAQCIKHPASFRDPSGFLFLHEGVLYRQINPAYSSEYDRLMQSGLYDTLCSSGCMVQHTEVADAGIGPENAYRIIRPEYINFISYPYEWCFSALKDAALLTLKIQQISMDHGMSLKDASAYNIQFHHGRPVLIDTLSFEHYREGQPWQAYKQFCQHFLAPLAIMAKTDIRLNLLLRDYMDGIPLDLASTLLPRSTWLRPGLAINLHIHAKTQKAYSSTPSEDSVKIKPLHVSRHGLTGIIEGLRTTVSHLSWQPSGTEWGDYYSFTNYSDTSFQEKKRVLQQYLSMIRPSSVWDMGANTGVFSRLASDSGIATLAFDVDPAAVEINYRQVRGSQEQHLLPLLIDLTNPSPALGWNSTERAPLLQRGPAGCIMALALIHHLAISNNVPFERIADFFAGLCEHLIIEFVPKQDSQVQRLLSSRVDIFDQYDRVCFENIFTQYFTILRRDEIPESVRTLYLMQNMSSVAASDKN
jgi:hypothetical protein